MELVIFSETRAALAEMKDKYNRTYAVETTEGLAEAKLARSEVKKVRTSLEKMRKEKKAPLLKACDDLDSEAEAIRLELISIEEPIDAQIQKQEALIEARRQEQREAQARFEAETVTMENRIRREAIELIGQPSGVIEQRQDVIANELAAVDLKIKEDGYKLEGRSLRLYAAKEELIQALHALLATTRKQEQSDADAKEARAKQEAEAAEAKKKLDADRAETERILAETRAAALKAEQEQEKLRKESEAARAKADAEAAKERERLAAEAKAAQEKSRLASEKAEAEAKAKRASEDAAALKERERIAAEHAKEDARLQAERRAIDSAKRAEDERKRIEAEAAAQKESERLAALRRTADGYVVLRSFCADYAKDEKFTEIVRIVGEWLKTAAVAK